jgi:hypothetical protein
VPIPVEVPLVRISGPIGCIPTITCWYQIKQTNHETYLGIPDDNGNLEHKEIEDTSDTFSSFFQ